MTVRKAQPAVDDLHAEFVWRMGPFRETLRWDLVSSLDLAARLDGLDQPTAEALFLSGLYLSGAVWKALESGRLRRKAKLTAQQVKDVRRVLTTLKEEIEAHNATAMKRYCEDESEEATKLEAAS